MSRDGNPATSLTAEVMHPGPGQHHRDVRSQSDAGSAAWSPTVLPPIAACLARFPPSGLDDSNGTHHHLRSAIHSCTVRPDLHGGCRVVLVASVFEQQIFKLRIHLHHTTRHSTIARGEEEPLLPPGSCVYHVSIA